MAHVRDFPTTSRPHPRDIVISYVSRGCLEEVDVMECGRHAAARRCSNRSRFSAFKHCCDCDVTVGLAEFQQTLRHLSAVSAAAAAAAASSGISGLMDESRRALDQSD